MTWMFIGTLRLSYTWLDHKGYRGASHPVCIPPVAWLRDLVWLHCLPEHSSSVAGLSVQPVPWVRTLCPEKSWKPGTTFDHPVLWLSWALSLPAETWFGWGLQWAGLGGCGYRWDQLPELYLDPESFTAKALRPQLEHIVCHRHSAPYEHVKGICYRIHGNSQ